MAPILGLHKNQFSITWAVHKGFQVITENKALILKKKLTEICFDKEIFQHLWQSFSFDHQYLNEARIILSFGTLEAK